MKCILHDFAVALQEKCQESILFCRVTSDHFVGVLKEDSVEDARQAYLTFTNSFVKRINSRYDQCNLVIATGLYEITENGRQCRRNLHGQDPQRFGEYQNNCIRNGKRL